MVERAAAKLIDLVRFDRLFDCRPGELFEVGGGDVEDLDVARGEGGEEGGAGGWVEGGRDVEEPVRDRGGGGGW